MAHVTGILPIGILLLSSFAGLTAFAWDDFSPEMSTATDDSVRCPADLPRAAKAACEKANDEIDCVTNSRNPLRDCVRVVAAPTDSDSVRCPSQLPRPGQAACQKASGTVDCATSARNPLRCIGL